MTANRKTAESMAGHAREISISEFFEKNRHLLGYDNKIKALLTIVKEGVDNALDATEEARILPDIYVKVEEMRKEKYKVVIKDNGPGIVRKQIPRIFGSLLYGSKFHRMRQSLGWDEPVIIKRDGKIEISPIGELVDSMLSEGEEIRDVSDMDIMVPAFDKNSKSYEFRRLGHVVRHKRMNEMIRITTAGNRTINATGCHSLFRLGYKGRVREAEARDLNVGDFIVAPKRIPPGGNIKDINILDYIDLGDIRQKWIYVYGVDKDVLDDIIEKSRVIHKKTDRNRKYYRIEMEGGHNVDILDDSMKQYLDKGFLPLHLVLRLGLKDRVRDCVLQTYFHGKKTRTPITWELTPSLMRFLGLFISEGHVDVRQIGLTFGRHESELIDEVCRTARTLGSNITLEQRERSIRVRAFGNILPILMEKWIRRGARNKRLPEFAFRAEESLRQHLLDGLYLGDGHMVKKRNCLMYNTISKGLANDVIYLWLMQGVFAFVTTRRTRGLGRKPSTRYAVSIYGKDIEKTRSFKTVNAPGAKIIVNSGRGSLHILDTDICQLRIKNIERITEGYDYVYDLSVPVHENFVGGFGGVSCHNSRGQQGIGVSGAVLYSQLTTGESTKVISSTGDGKTHKYEIKIDVKANQPKILRDEVVEDGDNKWHGVQITFIAEGIYREHKQSAMEYIKEVAISNPYANIVFDTPNGRVEFARGIERLPEEPKEIKPHLYGVEVGILTRMLHETKARTLLTFLTSEFSRVGRLSAEQIIRKAGISRENPQTGKEEPEFNISPKKVDHKMRVALVDAIKEVKLSRPPTDCLSPLGAEAVESGLKKELNPEFSATLTRPPEVYRGWPFEIEVGIAYGGSITEPSLMRFANRVPLLYQSGDCAITKAVGQVDWKRYGLAGDRMPDGPVIVFVHFASVWVPFTSESKEAIANYPIIIKEIKLALQDCARKLSLYLSGVRRAAAIQEKKQIFERYAGETAIALEELTGEKRKAVEEMITKLVEKRWGEIVKEMGEEEPEEEAPPTEPELKEEGEENGEGSGEGNAEEDKSAGE
jgi:DNA topoisomerase VI B subunit